MRNRRLWPLSGSISSNLRKEKFFILVPCSLPKKQHSGISAGLRKEDKDFSVCSFQHPLFTAYRGRKDPKTQRFSIADLRRDCFGLRPRNDRPPLFLVIGDINDTNADGFGADGIEFGQGGKCGSNLVLVIGVGRNNNRDGVVRPGAFVLEDA